MNKEAREAIEEDGKYALELVGLAPSRYKCVLGSYLNNNTFFGKLIRWWERGEASHTSIIFIDKKSKLPVLEIHALEGWGVIATYPAALAKKGAVVELRAVRGSPSAREGLEQLTPLLGAKYEKPYGFVTKDRDEDMGRWFCSELGNWFFNLQNCRHCLVSPPWARRSSKATEVVGSIAV